MKKINGFSNILVICLSFGIIVLIVLFFSIFLLVQTTNIVIMNVKEDMYSINVSAINTFVKKEEKLDYNMFDKEMYYNYLKSILIKNYNLDENLKSNIGLIKEVHVIKYEYLYGNGIEPVIYTELKVSINPPIFKKVLSKFMNITITESTKVNKIKY